MVNVVELAHAVELLDSIASPAVVERALHNAGLSRRVIREHRGFVPYRMEASVVEHVARAIGHQQLGAALAPQFNYGAYDAYARYVLGAHDLGEALRRGRQAFSLIQVGSEIVLSEHNGHLVVGRRSGLHAAIGSRHLDDSAIFIIAGVIRHFLGAAWCAPWIETPETNLAHVSHLEDITAAPVQAGAGMPGVAVRFSDLDTPNPALPDPREAVTTVELPALMKIVPPRSTEDLVRHALSAKLALGDLSEEGVAEHLSMGRRTLQRALRVEGTSFREIRARLFETRARALLAETRIEIDKIARSLGYDEPKSFQRAFRKWTGLTPHAYRAIHGARMLGRKNR